MVADVNDQITIEEAARMLGRSIATLRSWLRAGRISCARKLGRIYFAKTEIAALALQPAIPPKRGRRR